MGTGGTSDKAGKGAEARLCMPGYGGTDFILEVAGCHQRFLSRERVRAAWSTDQEKEKPGA